MPELDYQDSLLSSYDYELDNELIAQEPIEPRHESRLLIVEDQVNKSSRHLKTWDWLHELMPGDLIVMNNTRVVKARLKVKRAGGGSSELLLVQPMGNGKWLCLAKPAKRIRKGDDLFMQIGNRETMKLKVLGEDKLPGGRLIKFPSSYYDFEHIQDFLETFGEVPLPPYIKTSNENTTDKYQTSYATRPGAVAAPTAGLHLSKELLSALRDKGVNQVQITLHIGLGTFRPLEDESLDNLKLHSEWVEVNQKVINAIDICRARGGRVIAVGTTSVRALEGAYKAGKNKLLPFQGMIDLVIKPGYKFGVVDGLLTNFHLPKSSLLLLVSALIGRKKLLKIYKEAIQLKYRFFSYGDAMWISPDIVLKESRPQPETGS